MKRISDRRQRAERKRDRPANKKSSTEKVGKQSDTTKVRFAADMEHLRRVVDADN